MSEEEEAEGGHGRRGRGGPVVPFERGMDSTLSKLMPDLTTMNQENYREKRKKLQIFVKACKLRGQLAVTEGALMLLNSLEGDKWSSMEDLDFQVLDTMEAFDPFFAVFDRDYKYDQETEMPNRIEELVSKFHRLKNEPLRKYVARLQSLDTKLRELGVVFPEQFMGWLLLSRAAIPTWQIPNVKSSAGKNLDIGRIRDTLYHMFGPDSTPNPKDVLRVSQETSHLGEAHVTQMMEDAWEFGEEPYHEEGGEDYDYEYDNDEDYGYDCEQSEDIPPELEVAADQVEEAYATWAESRRQMNDLAKSQNFIQ